MNKSEVYLLNFKEVRRRSIIIWEGLPKEFYNWMPDKDAESFIQVIRHVLECEHLFHMRIISRGLLLNSEHISPWKGRPLINLEDELRFAEPYRERFLNMVSDYNENEIDSVKIYERTLGDYLLRAAYHESVHAGQFLSNLRALGIDRPDIWD